MDNKSFIKAIIKKLIILCAVIVIIIAYSLPKEDEINSLFDGDIAFYNGQQANIELELLVTHGGFDNLIKYSKDHNFDLKKNPLTKKVIEKLKLQKEKINEKAKEVSKNLGKVKNQIVDELDAVVKTKDKSYFEQKEKAIEQEDIKKEEVAEIEKVKKNKIAIIITGLGLNSKLTDDAIDLPGQITLGFSPYSADLERWIIKSKENKHSVLINLPLEPLNYPYDDAGPFTLLSDLEPETNIKRLEYILKRASDFDGLYTAYEEKFSKNIVAIEPIIRYLQQQSIRLVYGLGAKNSSFFQLAASLEYPVHSSMGDIDEDISKEYIQNMLQDAVETALRDGEAIVYASSYPITLKELKFWLPTIKDIDVEVVPITEF